jgi:hypothetical protein
LKFAQLDNFHFIQHVVTTYFSKRIEFYKIIFLNKYLIVAFHADAYFPLCREVFLYFIVRVEVDESQI